jgi:hypothetical protein
MKTDCYICPGCIQVFTKQDLNLKFSAKYIRKPDTMSHLQIGAEGNIDGRAFKIIGCLVLIFEEKLIQLWRVVDSGNQVDWLIQFPGYFLEARFTEINHNDYKDLELKLGLSGHNLPGLNINYTLNCITRYKYAYALGEVNMIMNENDKGLLYLFQSHKGQQFLLFVNSADSMTAITAQHRELSEFGLTKTKEFGLWSI